MFKQFLIHFIDNFFRDIIINYNQLDLIIIFPKIFYNLIQSVSSYYKRQKIIILFSVKNL